MQKELETSIFKTLSWFDIFNHPLTKEELFRFLWQPPKISYHNFLEELEEIFDKKSEKFDFKESFIFLKNRDEIVQIRKDKTVDVDKKLDIAKKALKKIRWVPFIKAVFVCNTVSSAIAKPESDVDFFIVVDPNRLWLARLLTTLSLSLLRLRRTKKRIKNKICLSFYISLNNLNLESIRIESPDVYLAYWLGQLMSIYDTGNIYKKLMQENTWAKNYLPNVFEDFFEEEDCSNKKSRVKKFFEKTWGTAYGDLIESQAKGMQMAKIKMGRKLRFEKDEDKFPSVIIKDDILKFHENDRRENYKEEWEEKIK